MAPLQNSPIFLESEICWYCRKKHNYHFEYRCVAEKHYKLLKISKQVVVYKKRRKCLTEIILCNVCVAISFLLPRLPFWIISTKLKCTFCTHPHSHHHKIFTYSVCITRTCSFPLIFMNHHIAIFFFSQYVHKEKRNQA